MSDENKKEKANGWEAFVVMLIVAVILITALIVISNQLASVQFEAVKRGYAEWKGEDGSPEFKWKEPKP